MGHEVITDVQKTFSNSISCPKIIRISWKLSSSFSQLFWVCFDFVQRPYCGIATTAAGIHGVSRWREFYKSSFIPKCYGYPYFQNETWARRSYDQFWRKYRHFKKFVCALKEKGKKKTKKWKMNSLNIYRGYFKLLRIRQKWLYDLQPILTV